jgi:hypothetical protein
MPSTLHPWLARDCRDARLRASLALDDELDEVGRQRLARHLEDCVACTQVVTDMRSATRSLRRARAERFRCELRPAQLAAHASSSGTGRHLAGAAVAVAALVLATGALPGRDDTPATSPPGAGAVVAPLQLPIGQRSAMDDFAAATASPSQRSS